MERELISLRPDLVRAGSLCIEVICRGRLRYSSMSVSMIGFPATLDGRRGLEWLMSRFAN